MSFLTVSVSVLTSVEDHLLKQILFIYYINCILMFYSTCKPHVFFPALTGDARLVN